VATYLVETLPLTSNNFSVIGIPCPFLAEEDIKVKRRANDGIGYISLTYNNDTQWNNNLSNGLPVSTSVYRVVQGNEIGLGNTNYYVQFSRVFSGILHILFRNTPNYVPSFVNGSALTAEDLNSAFLRMSYQAEEKDQIAISEANINLDGKFDKTGGTISGATTISANLSMNGNRIENVANPISANQVATKAYVDLANSPGGVPTILPDTITSTELSKVAGTEAVTTTTIRDLAVQTAKIADLGVTTGKLADGAVTTTKLGSSLTINFAGNSIRCADDGTANPLWESTTTSTSNNLNFRRPVSTNSIRALAITTAKVADGAITEPKLATDAVTTDKILNLNVTGAKIADSTITSGKLLTSGLSFTSAGALTAQATSVASLTSSGDLTAPSWTNHKLTNNWSNLDPSNDFISGFSLEYYPQYPGGVINVSAPPLTRKIKASPYPARINISHRHWNNVESITTMQTWLTRKFNVIDFNNTNFFTLNSDGSVTFNGVGAVGTWLVEGFMQFFWQTTLGNLKGYSRVAGPAYLKEFNNITERETYYNPTQFSSSSVAFHGTSCYADTGADHDPKSLFKGVIHIQNSSPQTFSIQHWVSSTQNASVGYRDAAGSPTSPFISLSERNTFAGATFTKISDEYSPFIG
jgi:hypothetical protein